MNMAVSDRSRQRRSRRWAAIAAVAMMAFASPRRAVGGGAMPVKLQAKFMVSVALYDRNMAARAQGTARVLVLASPGDVESHRAAAQLEKALVELGTLADVPIAVTVMDYAAPGPLVARCKDEHAAIVYVGPGLSQSVGVIADALSGIDVLSVGGAEGYSEAGTVVGLEVNEGKPKVVVNLKRAKSQHVAFRADLLKLARIVE